jgi:hypothetical protein
LTIRRLITPSLTDFTKTFSSLLHVTPRRADAAPLPLRDVTGYCAATPAADFHFGFSVSFVFSRIAGCHA